jgi:DNA-binding response OmpR family regulator
MKILVVEDDLALSDVISFTLRRGGFEVETAFNGLAALEGWQQHDPALVLLDLNLPKLDGLAVCRRIRAESKTPIIMLSVRYDDEAIVEGLELGADDYIVKPFSPSQLVARVRAVLRRSKSEPIAGELMVGGYRLIRNRSELEQPSGICLRLTPLEVKLLETLMLNPGQVLPADTLITAVWGIDGGDRAMLKQLVYRLRGKLAPVDPEEICIETVPGVGYAFVASPT